MNSAFQTKDRLGEVCPCYIYRQVRGEGKKKKGKKEHRDIDFKNIIFCISEVSLLKIFKKANTGFIGLKASSWDFLKLLL